MVFASIEFLIIFLPLFFLIYALVGPAYRNATLLICSWIFYGWWSPEFLLLFMLLALFGWIGGLAIDRTKTTKTRGWTLALFIGFNLSTLIWFKYANIFVETLSSFGFMSAEWKHIILPIGLSFIVLQSISYLIDVYRRTVVVDRSFVSFGAYQSMFVHLIAGPIIRYDWVKRELQSRPFDWPHFCQGARRFMIGMSMKVLIADTLSPIVDVAFALKNPSFSDAWLGCIAYSLQLFFDFSGYSAMAIGLGFMLGFRFPENFNSPYLASSIQDFWRRWHISLSSWIRDYLYIPLGGNRKGVLRNNINLLLTMSIAGLWHGGDSWNFLLWGMAHGIALCGSKIWVDAGLPKPTLVLSHAITLLFVMLAWVIFRAHTFDGALAMYAGQFGFNQMAMSDSLINMMRPVNWMALMLGIICVIVPALSGWFASHINPLAQQLIKPWPIITFVLSFALIASRGSVPFLYFQF